MSTSINIPVTTCISLPTTMQVNVNMYYTQAYAWVSAYLSDSQKKEMFGKDPTCEYNEVNNFWYLLMYIQMIADQQQIYINVNGSDQQCINYQNQFTCIIDYFKCLNIDITPLLCIFGFYCNCTGLGGGGNGSDEITTTLIVYP